MNGKNKDIYGPIVLAAMPGTKKELVERTGLSVSTVSRWIVKLRSSGQAHIGGWQRATQGAFMPRWVPGAGEDVPCNLQPFTWEDRWKRYRKKAKEDGRWDIRRAKKRASYRIANTRRDSLVSAFFGNVQKGEKNGKSQFQD